MTGFMKYSAVTRLTLVSCAAAVLTSGMGFVLSAMNYDFFALAIFAVFIAVFVFRFRFFLKNDTDVVNVGVSYVLCVLGLTFALALKRDYTQAYYELAVIALVPTLAPLIYKFIKSKMDPSTQA